MKKGPLSKDEKSFIDSNPSLSNEAIAKKLDRSVKTVCNYNQNLRPPKTETVAEKEQSDINLYARNKDRGVVVMTETASIVSDEKKKKTNIMNTRKYRDIIHKIKED